MNSHTLTTTTAANITNNQVQQFDSLESSIRKPDGTSCQLCSNYPYMAAPRSKYCFACGTQLRVKRLR